MTDLEQIQGSDGEVYSWTPATPRASGGFAKVYDAETVDGVQYVLKVVNIRDDDTRRWYADSRLAEREIDIAARIKPVDDGHLMPIGDHFHIGEDLVLVMPRADYSLAEHLSDKGPLTEDGARQLLLDSVAGLGELLDQGVVHRDIKPGNILWWRDRWVLADFGVARVLADPESTYTWAFTGTHKYWAPELFVYENAGFKTDLYALGCTVFEALAGKPPFEGPDLKAAHTNETPALPDIVDPALLRVLTTLLAKEPVNRPSDVRRIKDILSPSTELGDAQRTLQVVAARVADRKSHHEAVSREAARFKQMQTVARQEFSETWNELGELARAVDPDATVSNQGDNWFLECLDGRLSAELIRQSYGARALWLGQLVVRALDVDAASLVGNVDCVAETGAPRWRYLAFSPNYFWAGPKPSLGSRMTEGPAGLDTAALASIYDGLWPTPGGGMHVAPVVVTKRALTGAELLGAFAPELAAMIG